MTTQPIMTFPHLKPDGTQSTWVVYSHTLLDGSRAYFGICKFAEIFYNYDAKRSLHWNYQVANQPLVQIEIWSFHDKEFQAENARGLLIKEFRPIVNFKEMTTPQSSRVQCLETGVVYATQADACFEFGISSGNMSNHLAGRLKRVRGMMFKRV